MDAVTVGQVYMAQGRPCSFALGSRIIRSNLAGGSVKSTAARKPMCSTCSGPTRRGECAAKHFLLRSSRPTHVELNCRRSFMPLRMKQLKWDPAYQLL